MPNMSNLSLSVFRCVLSSSKYIQNSFSAGALPRTPLWELMTLSQIPQSAGEGHTHDPIPYPGIPPLGAFGVSICTPPRLSAPNANWRLYISTAEQSPASQLRHDRPSVRHALILYHKKAVLSQRWPRDAQYKQAWKNSLGIFFFSQEILTSIL